MQRKALHLIRNGVLLPLVYLRMQTEMNSKVETLISQLLFPPLPCTLSRDSWRLITTIQAKKRARQDQR